MLKIEINKRVKVGLDASRFKRLAAIFFKLARLKGDCQVSLAFIGEAEMKKLNHDWRGKNKVTDVLSFEEDNFISPEKEKSLGEVIVCVPQARRQARLLKHPLAEEIDRLLIHGLAHLLGYDHEGVSAVEAKKMFAFEEQVSETLKTFGRQ